jgi:hypothetical protein
MPKEGQAIRMRQNTAAERAVKKERIVELRGEAKTWREICVDVEISRRTIQSWRQQDEQFALALAAADADYRDFYVDECRAYALDPKNPYRHLMLMFLTKQADPSFRDNHKIEHVVSGGLAGALKQLAKMGRE